MKEINYLREEIRRRRIAKDLTQDGLAELAGLSIGAIKQVERGRNQPSVKTFVKIAKALGTTTDELLGLVESQKDPIQKHKELADKIYGKPEQKPITVGELGKEDLKELINLPLPTHINRPNNRPSIYAWSISSASANFNRPSFFAGCSFNEPSAC